MKRLNQNNNLQMVIVVFWCLKMVCLFMILHHLTSSEINQLLNLSPQPVAKCGIDPAKGQLKMAALPKMAHAAWSALLSLEIRPRLP